MVEINGYTTMLEWFGDGFYNDSYEKYTEEFIVMFFLHVMYWNNIDTDCVQLSMPGLEDVEIRINAQWK